MAFESGFRDFIWSDEQAVPYWDWRGQAASLGVAAALGGTAFAYGITSRANETRPVDDLARYARTLGNLSPLQILNTFRVPEWLSPFTSPAYQKMDLEPAIIGAEYLKSNSTYAYLKQLSGMSHAELAAAGIKPGGGSTASGLLFERAASKDVHGKLYSLVGNQRHLLHANAMMMQFTGETPSIVDLTTKNSPINKVAKSMFAAMDMWADKGFKAESVFTKMEGGSVHRPSFIPVHGFEGSFRGTTFMRAASVFGMERFNHLVTNIGDEMFGPRFSNAAARLGLSTGVRPGHASAMYGRFGMKAAGVVGLGLAIGELDWLRRQGGVPGQTAVSAAMGFGLGAVVTRAGFGSKAGMFAGIAAFTGQMIMPGFDQGIVPGIATTYALATQVRAAPFNPFNYYRRTLEGFLPGVSDIGVGVLSGLAVVGLANVRLPGTGKPLTNLMLDRYGAETFGVAPRAGAGMDVRAPKNIRDHFWDDMLDYAAKKVGGKQIAKVHAEYLTNGGWTTMGMRNTISAELYNSGIPPAEISQRMNDYWAVAEERYKTLASVNPVNIALQERLGDISQRYSGKSDLYSRGMMQLEGMAEQVRHGFFGAQVAEETTSAAIKALGFKTFLGRTGTLFAAGFLTHQVLTGGLFGSMQGYNELQDIYSGRQLVEVQGNRGWEAGGTPWEGSGSGTLRPHWYPIMMNRVKQTGVWGQNEDRLSPSMKFFLENFTYELERRTYYDRPYPISTPAFGNIPIIGPALGATIGQVFKPAKLMHAGEWIQSADGNLQFASVYEGWKREPSYDMGAHKPGIPGSPYDSKSVFSELNYQMRELGGLTGWAANMVSNMVVGEDIYFSDRERLAESGMMTSYRKAFWDMSLGGAGPIGEVIRRVLPNMPKDIERRNPLMNSMPTWIPLRAHFGDVYAQTPYGEASYPGAGYAALHPELRGTDPEDYPMIYRYDILSQVSPLSKEFRATRDAVYRQRAAGHLTPAQEEWMDRIDMAVTKQWNIQDFQRVDKNAIQLPGSSITQAAWFAAQKQLRAQAAPAEYLIPGGFRPIQKFLANRSAVEEYEHSRMYGTNVAFWDEPWRDFLRPSMYSLANFMGYRGKPLWRSTADSVNEQFDQIEFYKWMMMAEQAKQEGNGRDKIRYQYLASNTRMGVNPQGNPLSIYWTLPPEDRAFFNAFAFAEGSERNRILKMVPSDQAHLYQTLWSRIDEEDPRLWAGGPTGPDEDYLYRQLYGLKTQDLPPTDWIGYNQDVDLRDVKVRYVNELGRDLRDYGLWQTELRKAYSQPYLEGSTDILHRENTTFRGAISHNLYEIMYDQAQPDVSVFTSNAMNGSVQLEYNDNRSVEIFDRLEGYL